jgi:hypothetical protein
MNPLGASSMDKVNHFPKAQLANKLLTHNLQGTFQIQILTPANTKCSRD